MGKLKIVDQVNGCDLTEVELTVVNTKIEFTEPGEVRKSYGFRMFFPTHIDGGQEINEYMARRLDERYKRSIGGKKNSRFCK